MKVAFAVKLWAVYFNERFYPLYPCLIILLMYYHCPVCKSILRSKMYPRVFGRLITLGPVSYFMISILSGKLSPSAYLAQGIIYTWQEYPNSIKLFNSIFSKSFFSSKRIHKHSQRPQEFIWVRKGIRGESEIAELVSTGQARYSLLPCESSAIRGRENKRQSSRRGWVASPLQSHPVLFPQPVHVTADLWSLSVLAPPSGPLTFPPTFQCYLSLFLLYFRDP